MAVQPTESARSMDFAGLPAMDMWAPTSSPLGVGIEAGASEVVAVGIAVLTLGAELLAAAFLVLGATGFFFAEGVGGRGFESFMDTWNYVRELHSEKRNLRVA